MVQRSDIHVSQFLNHYTLISAQKLSRNTCRSNYNMARLTTCLFTENKQLSLFGPQHLLKLVFTLLSTANPNRTRHLECSKFAHSIDPDETVHTLKCLSIGTPKAINFPFVSNEKLMFFRCPSIQAHCNEAVIYLNFGTPKNNEFSIWNKWKIYYF